ncbi:hypothetical protein KP509_31G052800 [Ceratopteris richardii]|uniref:Uncharacterized protein n=1 Tax=Ceratopteris richardii TaxID=49495 RepID=A0A8T2QYS7_CERRI|nr:hypothetical protein KP509_31G052800 [Ceratopteris richardii]
MHFFFGGGGGGGGGRCLRDSLAVGWVFYWSASSICADAQVRKGKNTESVAEKKTLGTEASSLEAQKASVLRSLFSCVGEKRGLLKGGKREERSPILFSFLFLSRGIDKRGGKLWCS